MLMRKDNIYTIAFNVIIFVRCFFRNFYQWNKNEMLLASALSCRAPFTPFAAPFARKLPLETLVPPRDLETSL